MLHVSFKPPKTATNPGLAGREGRLFLDSVGHVVEVNHVPWNKFNFFTFFLYHTKLKTQRRW